jgi:hypothetical protein
MKTTQIPTGRTYQVTHSPDSMSRVIYDGPELTVALNVFNRTTGFGMFQLWFSDKDGKFNDRYADGEDHLALERHGPLAIELDGSEYTTLIFQHDDTFYLWGEGRTYDTRPGPGRLTDVNTDWGSGKWFVFCVADCAFPPMFAIRHDSWEDAYAEFVDWQVEMLKIEESDLKDYKEGGNDEGADCDYTSNGVPVDTEAVKGFEVALVAAMNFHEVKRVLDIFK